MPLWAIIPLALFGGVVVAAGLWVWFIRDLMSQWGNGG